MKKFTVIEGVDVRPKDINEARLLDRIVYDEEYYVTLDQCLEWNEKNNRIYTMIRDNETKKIIAYVNLSPVTNEYYEKILSGHFVDTYLPADAIVDYAMPDTYNLYFSSIVVHPDYQNSAVFLELFNAITRKFIQLGEEEIFVRRMVADAVSDKGEKFCELFGMTKRWDSDHDSEIYEVQMLPPKFRVSSRATRELYSYYEKMASELGVTDETKLGISMDAKRSTKKDKEGLDNKMHKQVFISYSSNEMKVAGQVCEFLEQNNIPCWIAPRNINPGDNYATQIVHAIRDCSVLVLLASESTNASGHVSNEVSLAFDNKKVIIPFKIEDIVFSDEYLYFLGRKHWIEAHLDMKAGLNQLLCTVQQLIGTTQIIETKPVEQVEGKKEKVSVKQEREFDKSIEIAESDYSREEIVKKILLRANKYTDGQISRFEKDGDFEEKKAYANNFLKEIYSVYRYNKAIEVDNYIDYIVAEILGDTDSEVVKISGLPGSAKSVLMQTSFYQTLKEFEKGTSNSLPFYIALGYYEKAQYDKANMSDQVKALMTKEMAEFFSFISKNPEITPILFIDEVREHHIDRVALENVLMNILKEYKIRKRVVSIDAGLIKNKNKVKRIIPIVSEKVSAYFEAKMVDSHNEKNAKEFIANIAAFYNYEIDPEDLFAVLKKLKFQEIDVFIVRSIADELLSSPEEIASISDLYVKWALTELYGDEERLLEVSRITFDYLFKNDFQMERVNFNDPQWSLIHNHQTFVDFLISYYLINELEKCDNVEDFNCDLFKIMLTSSTDIFVGALLEGNYYLQEKIYNIILTKYDTFETVQKSSAIFWLAKVSYKNLVSNVVTFLKAKFDELKPIVKKRDDTSQDNYDNQFVFRAISVALIVFEQTSVLDDYLCLLIINGSANAINRGAIIEYYGDGYQMAANDAFYLDTDASVGSRAIKALGWKINKALLPGSKRYVELDMLTLATLLQMRMQAYKKSQTQELTAWIKEICQFIKKYRSRPQNIKSEKIEFYFSSVYDDFNLFLGTDNFDISQNIYNTLRNLKDTKRRQWANKQINDPESVSEHTYSAWMLAMLFLPEELNHEGYSKREVLDMLLIHDMAEAKLGDQVLDLNEPSKELKEQNNIMRKLMVKGTYPNIANLTYYYNVWTGYYNGININAKIARDINLIQTVYTFCEYNSKYPGVFSDAEVEKWFAEKGKLETDVGFSIYEILVEKNRGFDQAEEANETIDRNVNTELKNSNGGSDCEYRVMSYDDIISGQGNIDAIRDEIVSIVNSVISPDNNEGLQSNLTMLENISESWRVLLNKDGDLVGYWVFVALQEEYFERAKKGTLNEAEISLETIEFIDFPGTYKGYLLLSGTKPEARTAMLVQKLYESMALHFEHLATRGIFFDEICAVAESPMGISAMRKLGMKEICAHEFGGKVFAGSLSKINENKYFSSFSTLKDLYQEYFNN